MPHETDDCQQIAPQKSTGALGLARERVLSAIQAVSSCHAWLDFEDGSRKAYCGDPDIPERWRRTDACKCAIYANAAMTELLSVLQEVELPEGAIGIASAFHEPKNFEKIFGFLADPPLTPEEKQIAMARSRRRMVEPTFRAILAELSRLHKESANET